MIVRFSVASCLHIHKQQIYKNINNRLAKYEIKLFFNPIQDRGTLSKIFITHESTKNGIQIDPLFFIGALPFVISWQPLYYVIINLHFFIYHARYQ